MKLKNVLVIAIAIISLGLIVACSDDVVATKDNNLNAYRVTESNGAFVYNETKYETLQDALDAIEKGKGIVFPDGAKTIKVTRSVTGPVAKVAANQEVVLDLGGNTLTFYGVKDSALAIGSNAKFGIVNGTLTLADKGNEDLAVIGAAGATELLLDGVTINAEGQTAVDAESVKLVAVKNGSAINGSVGLSGTSTARTKFTAEAGTSVTGVVSAIGVAAREGAWNTWDVSLEINNTIDAIDMKFGGLCVLSKGHATMIDNGSVNNNKYFATKGSSAISLPEGSQAVIESGLCMVDNTSTVTYYGSISEALLDNNENQTIVMLDDDDQELDEDLIIPYEVTIDLNGAKSITTTSITLNADLTIKNSGVDSTSEKTGVVSGIIVGGTHNVIIEGTAAAGPNKAAYVQVDGTVTGADITASYAIFSDDITATGSAAFTDSTFTASTENKDIEAQTISATNCIFTSGTHVYDLTATGANNTADTETVTYDSLILTNCTGKTGFVKATADSIKINNSTTVGLITGAVTASNEASTDTVYYDVDIKGKTAKADVTVASIEANDIKTSFVTVEGTTVAKTSGTYFGNIWSENSEFQGAVTATGNITDGKATGDDPVYSDGSTFRADVEASGLITLYTSIFNKDSLTYDPAVKSTLTYAESATLGIDAYNITGTTGAVSAKSGISVVNTDVSATLTMASVTASDEAETPTYYDVTLTGDSWDGTDQGAKHYIIVTGSVEAEDLTADYVTIGTGEDADLILVDKATISRSSLNVFGIGKSMVESDSTITVGGSSSVTITESTIKANAICAASIEIDGSTLVDLDLSGNGGTILCEGMVWNTALTDPPTTTAADLIKLIDMASSEILLIHAAAPTTDTYTEGYSVYITKKSGILSIGTIDAEGRAATDSSAAVNALYVEDVDSSTIGTTGYSVYDKISITTIEAVDNGNVHIEGNSYHEAYVAKKITATLGDVEVSYATVNGTDTTDVPTVLESVYAGGAFTSSHSTFNGTVTAATVTDAVASSTTPVTYTAGSSEFKGNVTSNGKAYFNGSTFTNSPSISNLEYGSEATLGIKAVNVTGETGAVSAKSGISVENTDVSATLTMASVTASDGASTDTKYYNVTLTGDYLDGTDQGSKHYIIVTGSVAAATLDADYVTLEGSITASTKVDIGTTSIVGDSATADNIYAPVVEIKNSAIMVNDIMKSLVGLTGIPADSVTITSPLWYNYNNLDVASTISDINTKNLSVTAKDNKLTVTYVDASGTVTIAGGTYTNSFSITGDGVDEITAGTFGTASGTTYSGTFSYEGTGSLTISDTNTNVTSTSNLRYTRFYARSTFNNELLPSQSGDVTLIGNHKPNGTNVDGAEYYALQFYNIDSLDSSSNVTVSGAWVREPDGVQALITLAGRTKATNKVYLKYDYNSSKEVLTEAHDYSFNVLPGSSAGNVTIEFDYAETGDSTKTLSKGLLLDNNASATLNFPSSMTVEGKIYVRKNGNLYSSKLLTNAYGLTGSDVVSATALPGVLDGSRYFFLTSSVTLNDKQVIVAKGKLYSSTESIGSLVGSSSAGYEYAYFYNSATSGAVSTVYAASGTAYVVATLNQNSGDFTSKETLNTWGTNVIQIVWNGANLSSSNSIWDNYSSSAYYYGYDTGSDLGWHYGSRTAGSGHRVTHVSSSTF